MRCNLGLPGGVRACECMLPDEGGWLSCPDTLVEQVQENTARAMKAVVDAGYRRASGNFCIECGGLLVRTGTCETCQDCGTPTGGCS